MKTYCKPKTTDIENWEFNLPAVTKCLKKKLSRNDFRRILCKTGAITRQEIAQDQLSGDMHRVREAEKALSVMLTDRIIARELKIKPIRQFERVDGLTNKLRELCQESPEQQIYEYIAAKALKPLFKAKLFKSQYGSIPKRGGVAGKRKIERLLRRKFKGQVAVIKGDIAKAYPSVTVSLTIKMLRRDIGKNRMLLWFVGEVMKNYPDGHLCIGGYLPAWLFNYVMSYVLRYLYDQAQIRRGKRQRLVYAIVCYADDFAIYGDMSKLKKAMKKATVWASTELGLNIKKAWQFYRIKDFEAEKENHKERLKGSKKRTEGVDMMGYVVRKRCTIIRGRVFRRIRRQTIRAWNDLKAMGYVPWWRACRIMAYKGWVVHSDSRKFADKYDFYKLLKRCATSASKHGKEIAREKRILLTEAACC